MMFLWSLFISQNFGSFWGVGADLSRRGQSKSSARRRVPGRCSTPCLMPLSISRRGALGRRGSSQTGPARCGSGNAVSCVPGIGSTHASPMSSSNLDARVCRTITYTDRTRSAHASKSAVGKTTSPSRQRSVYSAENVAQT